MKGSVVSPKYVSLAVLLFFASIAGAQTAVTWTNIVGCSVSNDTLKKTATTGWANGGASSVNWLAPSTDGYVEFYKNNVSATFVIGLSQQDLNQNYTSIGYGYYFDGSTIQIYESDYWRGSFGSVATGDTFRIERSGSNILYKKNGTTLRTVATTATYRLIIDATINNQNSILSNARSNFSTALRVDNSVTDIIPPATTGSISLTPLGGTSPYTYLWSNSSTSQNPTGLSAGTYTVTVTDNASATVSQSITIGYQVSWENTVNVSTTGNSITATSTTGGASSKNYIPAGSNGYVEYTIDEAKSYEYAFGLSEKEWGANIASMEYGFYASSGSFYIYESYSQKVSLGGLNAGDVMRIERTSDTIKYYVNGVLKRSVAADTGEELVMDVWTGANTPSVNRIKTNMGIPYGLRGTVTARSTTANDGAITLDVRGGTSGYTYLWSNSATTQNLSSLNVGTYTVTVTDAASVTATKSFEVGYQLVWENTSNVSTTSSSIASTNTYSTWNGGATSKNYIPSGQNGYVQFIATDGIPYTQFLVGLSERDIDKTPYTEEYALYKYLSGSVILYESGTNRQTVSGIKQGDRLRVERYNDTVKYSINGTVQRSVAVDHNETMLIDVSLGNSSNSNFPAQANYITTNIGIPFGTRATITDQVAAQANTGSITLEVFGGTSPFTYSWSNSATTQNLSSLNAGTYTVTVTDAGSATTTKSYTVGYQVQWQNITNGTTTTNSVTGTSTTGGASTKNFLKQGESGYIEHVVSEAASSQYSFGVSETDPNTNLSSMQYGFYKTAALYYIYESNTARVSSISVKVGDRLKVLRDGDTIRYKVNDTQIRAVFADKNKVLIGDIGWYTANPVIGYIKTNFDNLKDTSKLYWTGATDSLWNNANNWSYFPGNSTSAKVPDTTSTVYFNQYKTRNCYLNINTTVKAAQVDSGITVNLQSYTLATNHNFIQNQGTINGSSATLTVKDTLLLHAGTFTAPSTLDLYNDFTDTLNVFHHNNGTVVLKDSLIITTNDTFYNLTVNDTNVITLNKDVMVTNLLTLGNKVTVSMNYHAIQLNNSHTNGLSQGNHTGLNVGNNTHFTNYLSWRIANDTGLYKIPFVASNGDNVPVCYRIQTTGTGSNGRISFSTYALSAFQNTIVYPHTAPIGSVYDTAVVAYPQYYMPRYWLLDAYNYTTVPKSKVTLAYTATDLANNTNLSESRLVANRWDGTTWSQLHGIVDTVLHTFTFDSLYGAVNLLELSDSIKQVLPPTPPAAQSVCSNANTTFTFSSIAAGIHGNQIEWAINSSFTGSHIVSSPATITVSVPSGQTDTIWIRSKDSASSNVSSAVTTTATVTTWPVALVTPSDTFVIEGQDVVLNATGGNSYFWPDLNDSVSGVTVNPTADTTIYTVVASNTAGCTDTGKAMVRTMPFPVLSYVNFMDTIASGDTSQIIVYSTVPGTTFSWVRTNTSNVTGQTTGTGDHINVPLVNSTGSYQTSDFVVSGYVNGYSVGPVSIPQTVHSRSFYDVEVYVDSPGVTACTSTTYHMKVISLTGNVPNFKIHLFFPDSLTGFVLTPATGFTSSRSGKDVYIYTTQPFISPANLTYSVTIPCSAIPDSNVSAIYHQTVVVMDSAGTSNLASFSVDSIPNAAVTIPSVLSYPHLDQTGLNSVSYTLLYQHDTTVTVSYVNGGNADFNGAIKISGAFGCPDTILKVDSLMLRVNGAPVLVVQNPVFPYTDTSIHIPSLGTLSIDEFVTAVGCIPTTGCAGTISLQWGCDKDNLCKPTSFRGVTATILRDSRYPTLTCSRISPLPGNPADNFQFAWDTACTRSYTKWEYLIENRSPDGLPAYGVLVDLFNPFPVGSFYTYIVKDSVTLNIADSRFPNAVAISPPATTAVYDTMDDSSFIRNHQPFSECYQNFQSSSVTLITGFQDTIPVLLPGQRAVLSFSTYRCCPSDTFLFNQGVDFNVWKLLVTQQGPCNVITANDFTAYTDTVSGTAIHTYKESYDVSKHDISSDPYELPHPNLALTQAFNTPLTQIMGGPNYTCGSPVPFQIKNVFFPSNAATSDYATDLFTVAEIAGGPYGFTGLHPRGQFKVVFVTDPGLQTVSATNPSIVNGAVNWQASSWTGTSSIATAIFNLDSIALPDSIAHTSAQFKAFFQGSLMKFELQGCCSLTSLSHPGITAYTYFNPTVEGNSCATCWIPLSETSYSLELHCPGCPAPGMMISSYSLVRANYGYEDVHNAGIPDSTFLQPITSSYPAFNQLALGYSIVGDTLVGTTETLFLDGEPGQPHGFLFTDWQTFWSPPTPTLREFYLEQHMPHSDTLGITCIGAEVIYIPHIGSPDTVDLHITSQPSTNNNFLFHLTADSIGIATVFTPLDRFTVIAKYRICNNPPNASLPVTVDVANWSYLTRLPVSSTDLTPYQSGSHMRSTDDTLMEAGLSPVADSGHILFYCDGWGGPHYVYPIVASFEKGLSSGKTCDASGTLDIEYYISPRNGQNFPYEFRMVPGINGGNAANGPTLPGGLPITFLFDLPHDFTCTIDTTTSFFYTYNNGSLNPVSLAIGAHQTISPAAPAILPTNSLITGPYSLSVNVDTTYIAYSPPFRNLSYLQTTSGLSQTVTSSGRKLLLVGDEYFRQKLYLSFHTRCDSAQAKFDSVPLICAVIPGFDSTCPSLKTDTIFDMRFTSKDTLFVFRDTIIPTVVTDTIYSGNYITWHVMFADTATLRNMILFVDTSVANAVGLTGFGLGTGSPCTSILRQDTIVGTNGHVYYRDSLGGEQPFCISIKLKNCDTLQTLPFYYQWSCDGLPNPLPPDSNFCSYPDTLTLTAKVYPALLSAFPIAPSGHSTCDTLRYEAGIFNSSPSPMADFTASIVYPDSILIDTLASTLVEGSRHVAISHVSHTSSGGTTKWTFDIAAQTALNSSGAIFGANGFNNSDTVMYVSFRIPVKCNTTSIPAADFVFMGHTNCGDTVSKTCSFTAVTIDSNGCGPYVRLTDTCGGPILIDTLLGPHGVRPMSLSWSPSIMPPLNPGHYSATLTDANGCRDTASVTVDSLLTLTDSVQNATCGSANGSIFITPHGGSTSYTYHWSNGSTLSYRTGLAAGNYTVTVTDANANMCRIVKTINVGQSGLTVSLTTSHPNCSGAYNVVSTVSGNIGVPNYSWSNGSITPNLSGVTPNTYSLTVTNSGCTATASIPPPLYTTLSATVSVVQPTCVSTGSITIHGTGGTPPYTYHWNNGSNDSILTGLGFGNDTVTVVDAYKCRYIDIIHLTPPSDSVTISGNVPTCSGSSMILVAHPAPLAANQYGYLWSTGSTNDSITVTTSGTYHVTVTDPSGCTATSLQVVSFVNPPSVWFPSGSKSACDVANTCSLSVVNYHSYTSFAWSAPTGDTVVGSGHSVTVHWSGFQGGIVSVVVTDSGNICPTVLHDTVGPCCKPQPNFSITGPITACDTQTVTYSILNADTNYTYNWVITGGSVTTATGTSISFHWNYGTTFSVRATSVDRFCTTTSSGPSVFNVRPCCYDTIVADSAYLLYDIGLKQAAQNHFSNSSARIEALPVTSISGGYQLSTLREVYINDTFYVDTNLTILNSPNILMGPNAVIIVGDSVSFVMNTNSSDTSTLQAGCSQMWEGMRLRPTAKAIFKNAILRDAEIGVYANGGGKISADTSHFINNWKSILIDNLGTTDINDFVFAYDSIYTTTGGLLSPHSGKRGKVGIEVNNVGGIKLCEGPCYFLGLDTAMNLVNTGATLKNFNINGDFHSPYATGVGVGINARDNVSIRTGAPPLYFYSNGPTVVIGDSSSGNTLALCDTAIYSKNFNSSLLKIGYNTISGFPANSKNIGIGVTGFINVKNPQSVGARRFIRINNNNISYGAYGIKCDSNNVEITISANQVDMTSSTNSVRKAIYLSNTIAYSPRYALVSLHPFIYRYYPGDSIFNNTVTAAITGVETKQRNWQYIINNNIKLAGGASGFNNGIYQNGGTNALVTCNDITGSDTTDENRQFGIRLDLSSGSTVQCNNIRKADRGISAYGNGVMKLVGNRMDTCRVGIALDNNGKIGNQGINGIRIWGIIFPIYLANDNQWRGSFPFGMLRTFNSDGRQSIFYPRNNPSGFYYPPITTTKIGTPNFAMPDTAITAINDTVNCSIGCPPTRIRHLLREAQFVIADTLADTATTQRKWDKLNLMFNLLDEDTSVTNDTMVQAFVDSYSVTPTWKLVQIREAIDTLDMADDSSYMLVFGQLNAITTTDDIEYNLKAYALINAYGSHYGISGELKSAAADIASQCVFDGGPAVLEARAFMAAVDTMFIDYDWDSLCGGSSKRGENEQTKLEDSVDTQNKYHLIPNIYKDNFTAKIKLGDAEQGEVRIFAMDGRIMGIHHVNEGNNVLNLSEDGLQAGVYLYRVTVNGITKNNDKLIVVH